MSLRYQCLSAVVGLAVLAGLARAEEIAYVSSDGGVYFVDTDDPENPSGSIPTGRQSNTANRIR